MMANTHTHTPTHRHYIYTLHKAKYKRARTGEIHTLEWSEEIALYNFDNVFKP